MEPSLVFLGDSYVNGTGDPECLGWAGRLCCAARGRGLALTYYNLAVRGADGADVLERWRAEARGRLHDDMDGRLVVSFGLNDLWQGGVKIDSPVGRLGLLLEEAARRYPVLVVGPPPVADEPLDERAVVELSQGYARACQAAGVPYVEVAPELRRTGTWVREALAGDGAHPGRGGYEELAAAVDSSSVWRGWLGG